MLVFCDVEHASTEVLGFHRCLSRQQFEDLPDDGIIDSFKGSHDIARRCNIDLVSEAFRSLLERFLYDTSARYTRVVRGVTYESALKGCVIATHKRLFREVYSNLLCNRDVSQKHELGYTQVNRGHA